MTVSNAFLRGSVTFRGKRVARAQYLLLDAAADHGISYDLNSGRRTMAEQTQLYNHPPPGTPLVARPNVNAPHIMKGRANHADDIGQRANGNLRVAAFYRSHGVPVTFNVAGEPWHMFPISEAALLRAAKKLSDPLRLYPHDEARWIREYDRLSRRKVKTKKVKARIVTLQRVMKTKRKAIWRAAQTSGWNRAERRARYKSLLART